MYSSVPGFPISSVVPRFPFRVVLSGGLSEQYRVPFAAAFAIVSIGLLVVLVYKLQSSDREASENSEVMTKLEPSDSLESDVSDSKLASVADLVYAPRTYVVLLVASLGIGLLLTAMGRFTHVAAAFIFGSALFSIKAFLRFGWPYLERFYERRQREEQDPNSLRFQGFSTDVSIFLTLLVLTFVGMMLLIMLETALR